MTFPRALTDAEHYAFRLARLRAAESMPYFSRALFGIVPLALPGLGTFGCDRWWRVYMDPDLLTGPEAWTPVIAGAVLLHEVGHLIRDHHGRRAMLAVPQVSLDRAADVWGHATDAEINDDLLAAAAPLPDWVVTPAGLGLPDGKMAEDYYDTLLADPALLAWLADGGGGGCGSGAGTRPLPGELGQDDTTDDGPGAGRSEADGDLIRRQVAADTSAHAKGRGTVPAGLERWATGVLAPPVIHWSQVLRSTVRAVLAAQAGRTDYSYSRPSRRRVPRVIRPAMRGPAVTVAIVVDTSGSMSQADLDAALSEVGGVLAASGVSRDRVMLLCCDAAASRPRRVRSVRDVRLTGGGGTDMPAGIDAAQATRPAPNVIIVLTDGETPWPERRGRAALICAIISRQPPAGTPEWAATVHIAAA